MVRAAKAGGLPVTAEATPHHFTLTDAECASLRPGVQGQPAAAHRRRRRRGARPASADGTIDAIATDHAPHAPEPKELPVRPGAAGDARPRDGAGPRPHRARPARWPRCSPCCRGGRRPSPASATTHGGPIAAGRPANLCVIDPTATWMVDPPTLASQPATRPTPAASSRGRVRHTILRGEAGRRRRRGPAMSRRGPRRAARPGRRHDVRGRGHRRRPAGRRRHRRGRVQHGARPATRRCSPTRPTPARSSPSPTRTSATTAPTPTTTRAARPFCRGVVVRDLARRRSNWRADDDLDDFLRRHGVPGIAGIDTRRLTRHIRDAGAMPGAFGTADEATLKAAAVAEPGTDGIDLVATVTTRRAVHGRRRAPPGRRLRLRHQDDDPAPPRRASPPSRSCRRRRRPPTCSPASPTACSSRTAPATRPTVPYAADAIRGLLGEVPVFGICLGHQLLGTALGGAHREAAVRPPRRQPPGAPPRHRPGRDHQPEPQLRRRRRLARRRRRGHPRQPQRRRVRGPAGASTPRAFSVQHHPEAGPGPARLRLPVRRCSPS